MKIQINEEILWDYSDGLLPDSEILAVEEALASTPAWRVVFEKIKSEKALLSAAKSDNPSVDFSKNLMAAWGSEQKVLAKKKAKKDYSIQIIFSALLALLGSAILILGYALLKEASSAALTVNTDWAANPNYLYTMTAISILLAATFFDTYTFGKVNLLVKPK